jgi:dihydrofolate synthase / folylpolyglutamate synthase
VYPWEVSQIDGNRALAAAVSRLDGLINWEHRDRRGGMDRSLEPITDLLERLDNPHHRWKGVLVAGTKGKGSVAALVAAALRRAGVRVGLYASPHVERVNERIGIDGDEVGDLELAAALDKVLDTRDRAASEGAAGGAATWFDSLTAAAFLLFAEAGVEWAVVEVGIGGRLDSTRAVDAPVSVVTNVDLEHTATLGDTLPEIAAEKGAVLAPGGVLITGVRPEGGEEGEEEAFEVLEEIALDRDGRLVAVSVGGALIERNIALAGAVLNELGQCGVENRDGTPLWRSALDAEAVVEARLPARMEHFLVRGVTVVLDSGHVASSIEAVLGELERDPGLGRRPKLLIALGKEKDAKGILKTLLERVDRCLCTSCPHGQLFSAQDLAQAAFDVGHDPEAWEEPREALEELILDAEHGGGWVLVTGSFYLSGELRAELAHPPADHADDRLRPPAH